MLHKFIPLLLLFSAFGAAQADTYSLPGISPSGIPNFTNYVDVTWTSTIKVDGQGNINGGTATLEANFADGALFTFNTATNSYSLVSGEFKLKVPYLYDTVLNEFYLKDTGPPITQVIKGEFAPEDYDGLKGTLYQGTLDSWAWDSDLIGFNTTINQQQSLICDVVICTDHESLYLSLGDGGFDPSLGNHTEFFKGNGKLGGYEYIYASSGTAITTIPLPAAVWLFGSGLLGIAGMARKRKAAA